MQSQRDGGELRGVHDIVGGNAVHQSLRGGASDIAKGRCGVADRRTGAAVQIGEVALAIEHRGYVDQLGRIADLGVSKSFVADEEEELVL